MPFDQGVLLFSWLAYPSAPLRVRKIRSLSGAEAPDFQKKFAKFLRSFDSAQVKPSAPL